MEKQTPRLRPLYFFLGLLAIAIFLVGGVWLGELSSNRKLIGVYAVAGGLGGYIDVSGDQGRLKADGFWETYYGSHEWNVLGGIRKPRFEMQMPSPISTGKRHVASLHFAASGGSTSDFDLLMVHQDEEDSLWYKRLWERVKSWKVPPPSTSSPPAVAFLHRMIDTRARDYSRLAKSEGAMLMPGTPASKGAEANFVIPTPNSAEMLRLATTTLSAHPDDLYIRVMYLDALIRSRKWDELRQRIVEWRGAFTAAVAAAPGASSAFEVAEQSLHAWEAEKRGKNGYRHLLESLAPTNDLPTRIRAVEALFAGGLQPGARALVGASTQSMPNFLEAQVLAKVARNEVLFRLIQGNPEGSARLAAGMYRYGQHMETVSGYLISRLIGIALRAIAAGAMEVVVLDASEEASFADTIHMMLEELNRTETPTEAVSFSDSMFRVNIPVSDGLGHNFQEMAVRHRVANAKFQNLRALNAARRVLLSTGSIPDMTRADALAPLLPSGAPIDPFSPTSAPLMLLHDATSDTLKVYSVGPDEKDGAAHVQYDPTNGTVSAGDIISVLPRQRKFPFPKGGVRVSTTESLFRQFPAGLPLDGFADDRTLGLSVAQTTGPVYVFSFGPDTDQASKSISGFVPTVQYDPTNGTVSKGDLFMELPPE